MKFNKNMLLLSSLLSMLLANVHAVDQNIKFDNKSMLSYQLTLDNVNKDYNIKSCSVVDGKSKWDLEAYNSITVQVHCDDNEAHTAWFQPVLLVRNPNQEWMPIGYFQDTVRFSASNGAVNHFMPSFTYLEKDPQQHQVPVNSSNENNNQGTDVLYTITNGY